MPIHTNDLDAKLIHSKAWNRAGEETLLKKWLTLKGITYRDMAERVGVSHRSITYWCHGQQLPMLLPALKIEEVTEGKVPAVSWLSTLLGRTLWAALNRTGLSEKEEAEAPRYRSHRSDKRVPIVPPAPTQRPQGPVHTPSVRRPKDPEDALARALRTREAEVTTEEKPRDQVIKRVRARPQSGQGDEATGKARGRAHRPSVAGRR